MTTISKMTKCINPFHNFSSVLFKNLNNLWMCDCQCILIEMIKKSENNMSTERILKSKYLDKDKQKTIPLIKHKSSAKKIKLTDLCPEEKLKIGELIKALDERRRENQSLSSQLEELISEVEQLKIELNASRFQFENIRQKYQEKEKQVRQLNDQNNRLNQLIEKQVEKNNELNSMYEQSLKKMEQFLSQKTSLAIQTVFSSTHQSTQTILRAQDTAIQTEKQEHERDLFYRPHSKSFEKIMKAPISVQLPKNNNQNTQIYQTSKHKSSSSHSRGKQSLTDKRSVNEILQEQEFDELNQKWDKLKVKHQRGRVNWEDSPHSFHVTEAQKESSRKKSSKLNQIDEIALNRMLKLKDFSASKLIRAGKQITSEKKKQKESPQVNYIKSPYFNRIQPDSAINIRVQRPINKSHLTSQNQINFYDSSIFEVESNQL